MVGLAYLFEFIDFTENAKIGALVFSGKKSSSKHDAVDDGTYDFSVSRDLAINLGEAQG
ncbi:MAG: hypothetical protein HYR84_10180 [Planctomycetes bacterium]|nr:hypothetical protein [Planctomycetota bacterium]